MERQPESAGPILGLWIFAALAGNLFAAYWLLQAFLLHHTSLRSKLTKQLRQFKHSAHSIAAALATSLLRVLPSASTKQGAQPPPHQQTTNGSPHALVVLTAKNPAADGSVRSPGEDEEQDAAEGSHEDTAASLSATLVDAVLSRVPDPFHFDRKSSPLHSTDKALMTGSTRGTISLEWRNLSYCVPSAKGSKALLRGVWGSVRGGQMMALMGASGAGKSTLLDLLTCRKAPSSVPHTHTHPPALQANGGAEDVHEVHSKPATGKEDSNRGVLLLNGKPAKTTEMRRVSTYIPQDDSLLPQMTVGEVMQLHAALTLPPGTPHTVSEERQHTVLAAMGLLHTRHTLVGGALPGGLQLRGISGGERKRLSIGASLIPNPQIVFADEPTSGLDAFAALSVMAYLAAMARTPLHTHPSASTDTADGSSAEAPCGGCAVLVSIHQPRAAIWGMFDKVLLMANGRMVFEGSSQGSTMVDWFAQHVPHALTAANPSSYHTHTSPDMHSAAQHSTHTSNSPPIQLHYSPDLHGTPADWIMDLLTAPSLASDALISRGLVSVTREEGQQCLEGVGCSESEPVAGRPAWVEVAADAFVSHFLQCQQQVGADRSPCEAVSDDGVSMEAGEEGDDGGIKAAAPTKLSSVLRSWWQQQQGLALWWKHYKALVWREKLAGTRNPTDIAGRMLIFVWVALLGNFLMYGGGKADDGAGRIRVCLGWMFSALFFFLVMPFLFMSVYSADKRTYLADIAAGLYTPGPFYAAKLTTTLPFNILIALLFSWVGYGMFGYRNSALALVQFTAVTCVFSLVALQWMFFATTLAPNQDLAFVLAVGFAVVNLLITAFFMGPMDPAGWPWVEKLRYISALDYAWQGVATAELKDRWFSCTQGGAQGTGVDALGIYPDVVPPTPTFRALLQGLDSPPEDCVVDANVILQYYKINPHVGTQVGALVAYLLVLHLLTYASLRWNTARMTKKL